MDRVREIIEELARLQTELYYIGAQRTPIPSAYAAADDYISKAIDKLLDVT